MQHKSKQQTTFEGRRIAYSAVFPSIFMIICWLIKILEVSLDISFSNYGVYPLKITGLPGIIFSVFLHGDFNHLFSNTIPFIFLASGIFYFYPKIAHKIIISLMLISGIAVWLVARPAFHIGASGVIYGMASFLFVSGLIHKNKSFAAISLVVTFMYGSIVWGMLPGKEEISWESHLSGFIVGILLSLWFGKHLPVSEKEIQKIEQIDTDFTQINVSDTNYTNINYIFIEDEKEEELK